MAEIGECALIFPAESESLPLLRSDALSQVGDAAQLQLAARRLAFCDVQLDDDQTRRHHDD
jgi:hypothetical protein